MQIHLIKSFHDEFFSLRMNFGEMIEHFGLAVSNEIMLNRNQRYYIEVSYYQEQGDV